MESEISIVSSEVSLSTVQQLPKGAPQKIAVEEEQFNKRLTGIIRRDFFPDVTELETRLEPFCSNDSDVDPAPTVHEDGKADLRLDQFLNQYESEDDASFKEMLMKANEMHHQRHAWLHEKEQEYAIASEEKLSIAGTFNELSRPAGLKTWTYTAKNSLMYIPDGVENSTVEMIQEESRPREIVHSNTRLPDQFVQKFQSASNSDMAKKCTDKVGVDGKILQIEDSPKVNGYGFMATPKISPGVDASPLMTWGSIEGTPVRINSAPVPAGPSFKMPKIPAREQVALKLADQVAKANRDRKKISAMAASPLVREEIRMTPTKSDRLRLLSPAARKLIDKKIRNSDVDRALSASYSPQLVSNVKTPRSAGRLSPSKSTPTKSLSDNLLSIKKRQ